jgi:hypothetical protein
MIQKYDITANHVNNQFVGRTVHKFTNLGPTLPSSSIADEDLKAGGAYIFSKLRWSIATPDTTGIHTSVMSLS